MALDETAAYCSPVLVTYGGTRQLIALAQRSIIAVDVETGKLLWSHPHVTPHDQNVNAPAFCCISSSMTGAPAMITPSISEPSA